MPVTSGLAVNPPQAGGYNARLKTNAQRANGIPVDQEQRDVVGPYGVGPGGAGPGAYGQAKAGGLAVPGAESATELTPEEAAAAGEMLPPAAESRRYARDPQDSTQGQIDAAAGTGDAAADQAAEDKAAADKAAADKAAADQAAENEALVEKNATTSFVRALFGETMGLSGAQIDDQAVAFLVQGLLQGNITRDELRAKMLEDPRAKAYAGEQETAERDGIRSDLEKMFMQESGQLPNQQWMDGFIDLILNGTETMESLRQKARDSELGIGFETPGEKDIIKWYTDVNGNAPTQEQINHYLNNPDELKTLQTEYTKGLYGTEAANETLDEAFEAVKEILDRVRKEGLDALNDANSESGAQLDAALEKLLALVQQSTKAATDAINQGKDEANTAWDEANSEIAAMIAQAIGALQPYNAAGQKANALLMDFLGANGPEAQAKAFEAYEGSPGQQHIIDQGQEALIASAAATGQLGSPNTKKALLQFAIGEANKNFDTRMAQLGSVADRGLAAAQTMSGTYVSGAGLHAGIGEGKAGTAMGAGLAIADVHKAGMAEQTAGVKSLMGQKAQNTITTGSSVADFIAALGSMEAQAGLSIAGQKAQNIYNTGKELANMATELGTTVSQEQLDLMKEYDTIITAGISTLDGLMTGRLKDVNATHIKTLQDLINMDEAYAQLLRGFIEKSPQNKTEDGGTILDVSQFDWESIGEGIMGLFGDGAK